MKINPINLISTKNFPYRINNNASKGISFRSQEIKNDTFLIRMEGYEKDLNWANDMNNALRTVTRMVKDKKDFNEILKWTANEIYEINYKKAINDNQKKLEGKPLKYKRNYLFGLEIYAHKYGSLKDIHSQIYYSLYPDYRGKEYYRLYKDECKKYKDKTFKPHSNKEYPNAKTTTIQQKGNEEIRIYYAGPADSWTHNIEIAKEAYEKLINKENPTLEEIINTTATIQWLLIQATPFEKGSDSINNLITRGILGAYDVKISKIKKGKSLDFEGFYRNLDDYIKIYPDLFEEKLTFVK